MKVLSYRSPIPEWRDPAAPNYTPLADWTGAHVRVTVPISIDPQRELHEARVRLQEQYPGAVLHLVPEYQQDAASVGKIDIQGTDEDILRQYLDQRTLPADVHPDMVVAYLRQYLPQIGLFGVQGLEFLTAHATNVLCFEKATVDLTHRGLTVVSGNNLDWGADISNAAGKSSWVTLPFVALFGKTFKGQTHDAWAHRHNKDKAIAAVKLRLPDGSRLDITRTRRPPSLRAYQDDVEISLGDANQTQALIEALTNFTWEVATNAVYIGQREIGSVFGTDKDRKELFTRLLGLDRFIAAETKIRTDLRKSARAVQENESDITGTDASIAEARLGMEEIERALEEAPVVDTIALAAAKQSIEDIRAEIRERERLNASLDPELAGNQKRYEDALFKSADLQSKSSGIQDQLDECATVNVGTVCTRCGSKVSPRALQLYTAELKRTYDYLEEQIAQLESAQVENRNARQVLLERIRLNNLENKRDSQRIETLSRSVGDIERQIAARKSLEVLVGRKKERLSELSRLKSIHSAARVTLLYHQEFLEFCLSVIDRHGLPAYLCQIAVPTLNQAAARYSQAFTEGEIGIQFTTQSTGDVDVDVINLHGGSEVKDLSEGELRMAAIIAALAFRELVPIPLLVLDEPSQGLDAVNAQRFATGLNSVIERFRHVILISHNRDLLAVLEPDQHVEITKENGLAIARLV